MNPSNSNLVVIDIETTGTNPFIHDALAISFVPVNSKLSKLEVFIRHSNPEWNDFAKENFKKFQPKWQQEAAPAKTIFSRIEAYISSTFEKYPVTLIGHNIGFDVAFLRKIAYQAGHDYFSNISHRVIDTHTMLAILALQGKIPKSATSSDGAFKYFNIDSNPALRHSATHDAELTRLLFLELFKIFSK